ncbi:tannase/feruloyl esterase family alpha/beta hydrolase [Peteryoungia desertarenae]|uniref:Tannase/feruloyl esterase family alpha/beta hydrolase n=1 Tax=Peteryoungia desertarenae TaxID=1813451 RepID=A0ABX6QIX8_9HYPH|nr:tannase/feruloyl esterase family alpha/beta hydrolase [Peteryoungia desertarenae]QLF68524.1 tannase/feruloyl esterase family alpha/beta hydrolase [Peteryoungia desertarenae]
MRTQMTLRCSAVGIYAALMVVANPIESAAAPQELAVVKPVKGCAELYDVDLVAIGGEGSSVTSVAETTSNGIPVCSLQGKLSPAINFQVLLPIQTWQQRYLQVGCGGLCGNITLRSGASDGCEILAGGGFVMAATDMGHSANEQDWGLDEQKRIDFAYRAQHLTAKAAAAVIETFYGQSARFSYFNGCSDGGREALMQAQRYPDDFDGVIAGAPAMLFQIQNTLFHGWQAASNTAADGTVILTSDKLPVLHNAVLSACDDLDGVQDGIISLPGQCNFDPKTIICANDAQDSGQCLTAEEAEVVRKFYDGPRDAVTGRPLTAGQPLPGSELNWQGVYVADGKNGKFMSPMAALPVLRMLAFSEGRTNFELSDLRFEEATLDALRARHALFDATNTDLGRFEAGGGKLILWHGLADAHIAPANTLAYYKGLQHHMGTDKVHEFVRLYLLPGMSHCGGGQALGHLDLLTAMMAWVEGGAAPEAILTTSIGEESDFGQPDFAKTEKGGPPPRKVLDVDALPPMTRPAYPYPYVAEFGGSGEVTDGGSWHMGPSAEVVRLRDWPGQDLFSPYEPANQ